MIDEIAIAELCHEVNRAACAAYGDHSQPAWKDAPDWQRQSAIEGVRFVRANPDAPTSATHDNWLSHKRATGWTFGPIQDPDAKTHPCMVPFDELPVEQRIKDHIFRAIVRTAIEIPLA